MRTLKNSSNNDGSQQTEHLLETPLYVMYTDYSIEPHNTIILHSAAEDTEAQAD